MEAMAFMREAFPLIQGVERLRVYAERSQDDKLMRIADQIYDSLNVFMDKLNPIEPEEVEVDSGSE